jgi:hypothetical protein
MNVKNDFKTFTKSKIGLWSILWEDGEEDFDAELLHSIAFLELCNSTVLITREMEQAACTEFMSQKYPSYP